VYSRMRECACACECIYEHARNHDYNLCCV